jgi:hypothetical protein
MIPQLGILNKDQVRDFFFPFFSRGSGSPDDFSGETMGSGIENQKAATSSRTVILILPPLF